LLPVSDRRITRLVGIFLPRSWQVFTMALATLCDV
jgi:hypothetical protein